MVYVFLAEGFEEIEALTAVDVLRRAGVEVVTVGVAGKTVIGGHGISVTTDTVLDETELSDNAEMAVLPGGGLGTENLAATEKITDYIRATLERGAFVGAICAAPSILGKMGLLDGRMATCYPGFEYKLLGAETYDCDVIRDGEIITGRAMGASLEFAIELVAALKGEDEAERIRESVIA